jgi:phosphomannomutase
MIGLSRRRASQSVVGIWIALVVQNISLKSSAWIPPLTSTRKTRRLPGLHSFRQSSTLSLASFVQNEEDRPVTTLPATAAASLEVLTNTLHALATSGNTDIRGSFVDDELDDMLGELRGKGALLTPTAAYCLGHALGQLLILDDRQLEQHEPEAKLTVLIGCDPRTHGPRLARAMAAGLTSTGHVRVELNDNDVPRLASTPAMAWIVTQQQRQCEAAVMVTASHLPVDKNGLKVFTRKGWSKESVERLGALAIEFAQAQFSDGSTSSQLALGPYSEPSLVGATDWVSFFPSYVKSLQDAVLCETQCTETASPQPLKGLKIVVNAGHGSGSFLAQALEALGADALSGSINVTPDGAFPAGVPNPEDKRMVAVTQQQCQAVRADLGIMLDTDADRCGFIVPSLDGSGSYEALNRNRLIALLGVAFSRQAPGCAIVTDSVTSEGLSRFLQDELGLKHVRYLKGYANVIRKAKELTASGSMTAEVAIETSGHCAMRENNYIDDGTYTAVKVVSLLAREKRQGQSNSPLLELIRQLPEMPVVDELRLSVVDGSLDTMRLIFALCVREIERLVETEASWELDVDNLEGIRVRLGQDQFFMLRKSLHDPIISLQIEALSNESALECVITPLLQALKSVESISQALDMTVLQDYH